MVENIVRKEEIACYKQFLLFSYCFQQLSLVHQNAGLCGNGLKLLFPPCIVLYNLYGLQDLLDRIWGYHEPFE